MPTEKPKKTRKRKAKPKGGTVAAAAVVHSSSSSFAGERVKKKQLAEDWKKKEQTEAEKRRGTRNYDTHKLKAAAKEETFGDGQVKSDHVVLLQLYRNQAVVVHALSSG